MIGRSLIYFKIRKQLQYSFFMAAEHQEESAVKLL